jgi:hypothetical protein
MIGMSTLPGGPAVRSRFVPVMIGVIMIRAHVRSLSQHRHITSLREQDAD